MNALRLLALSLSLAGLPVALADEKLEKPPANIPEHAPPAEIIEQEKEHLAEPEVTIIKRKEATIEEYRINGRLYMIKVTPKRGAPYFLVDNDGNGTFESRRADSELEPDIMIPNWVLFRW